MLRGRIKAAAVGGILTLVAIGVVAYFSGVSWLPGTASAAQGSSSHGDAPAAPGLMYTIKERVVNLSDTGVKRYLKVSMSIEFAAHASEVRNASVEERREKQAEFDQEIAPRAPQIEDAVIALLSSKTTADVVSAEGKMKLKTELIESLNQFLGHGAVVNIYFTQFLMQ